MFRPRAEDYARVFTDELPARIAYFEALWSKRVEIVAPLSHVSLLLTSTTADQLAVVDDFPSGYNTLTGLVPDRVWLAWKYVKPGQDLGMAYDGLVWLDDRFAWFPKPWRVIRSSPHPMYVD